MNRRRVPILLGLLATCCAACGGGGSHVATGVTTTAPGSTASTAPSTATPTTPGATTTTLATTSTAGHAPTTGSPTTGGPTTTRAAVTTVVTHAPVTTTTTAGPPTTSRTHNPAIADCAPATMATAASTDAPSYAAGATVTITVRVTNRGTVRCQFQPPGGPNRIQIENSTGTVVWEPQMINGVYALPPYYVLGAGQSYTAGTDTWDQHSCTAPCRGPEGPAVPAGQYKAVPAPAGTGPVSDASFAIR